MFRINAYEDDAVRIKDIAAAVADDYDIPLELAEAEVVSALFQAVDRNGIDINRDFIWG